MAGIALLGLLVGWARQSQPVSATPLAQQKKVSVPPTNQERGSMIQQSTSIPEQAVWATFKRYHYGMDHQNVVYIHMPNHHGRVPLAILVHGGNYLFGSATDYSMLPLACYFVDQGYAVASVEYRTLQHHRWPVPVEDVRQAVSYIFRSIGDRVDQTTYVGYSAGAVTGALLLYTDHYGHIDGIDRFIGLSGLYDKTATSPDPVETIRSQSLERIDLLRVIDHIRNPKQPVPALLVEGSRDYFADQYPDTPQSHAEKLAGLLQGHHIPAKTFWSTAAGLDNHDGPIALFAMRDRAFMKTLNAFLTQ
jgi:acetyl esterase/lipase